MADEAKSTVHDARTATSPEILRDVRGVRLGGPLDQPLDPWRLRIKPPFERVASSFDWTFMTKAAMIRRIDQPEHVVRCNELERSLNFVEIFLTKTRVK